MLGDLRAYADSIHALEKAALGESGFDQAVHDAETAERAFKISREKLHLHVSLHRCA
jgi:hypothetical protein